jgi:hypothetical protein
VTVAAWKIFKLDNYRALIPFQNAEHFTPELKVGVGVNLHIVLFIYFSFFLRSSIAFL